ncbi:MAG: hypothetical protein G01um101419_242 [Parcubacteria group bacterium Gr01-1014_19]|nr:MAG: hypothetical protein G01um101419_242 [Parcubacteria group bacterium Gr01-1014_19]
MAWYWWVACALGYAGAGAAVTYFWAFLDCGEHYLADGTKKKNDDDGEEVLIFIFWPICLPIVIGWMARNNRENKAQEKTKTESSSCEQSETSKGAK